MSKQVMVGGILTAIVALGLLVIIATIAIIQVANPTNVGTEIVQILAFTLLMIMIGGPAAMLAFIGQLKLKG